MVFEQFLDILWLQKATGENGFEGLVRKLLEKLTSQRFFLSLSGRQEGRDIANDGYGGNFVAAECKRYKEGTTLGSDELLVKLVRAACSIPPPDIWVVVTTKRLGEQHHRDLQKAADQYGITYFPIDAQGGQSSSLLSICSSAPEVVANHLQINDPKLGNSEAKDVERYLSDLGSRTECSDSKNRLRDALLHDTIGYSHWRYKQNDWLAKRLQHPKESVAAFGQDIAVRESEHQIVKRSCALQILDDWWASWSHEQKHLAILGEEGDGKSWIVADWLADRVLEDGFPPVLFVPSVRLGKAEPEEMTIEALQWQIGEARTNYWSRRLNRWITSSVVSSPAFLLVLDGVNERPGFEWKLFLARLEVEPFAERVAVLMTCRTLFWEEHLTSPEWNCTTWSVDPYDEDELKQALIQSGHKVEEFDSKLLPLLKKPRYFDLTIKLRDRLSEQGEITVERLIYEDWRDQMSRKRDRELLTHNDFQELISNLSERWEKQGVLKRIDIHAELEPYGNGKELFEQLQTGRVLRKGNGQWVIDQRYLILGLGLLLADEVRQEAQASEASVDELIASRLEPQAEMDLKVSICGMALLHALYLDDYPETGRLALFRAWIRGRNIAPDDWRRVPAYLPLRPEVYLRMAEHLWSVKGENREAQDAFMEGFLRFGRKRKVQATLIQGFERWMGFVHPDGHHGRHAQNEEERKNGRQALQKALGSDNESGPLDLFGYRLCLTRDEGWQRLAAVALAVISHQERAPHIPAMATYAVAGAVMGHPWHESAFNWVLRTAPDNIEEPLVRTAGNLMSQETPTAQRAAWWLLNGLHTADALELRDKIPPEHRYKNPMRKFYEENPCEGFFLWDHQTYKRCVEETRLHPTRIATQLREVILDPHLEIPEQLPQVLDNAGKGIDLNSVWSGRGRTAEDSVLEEIEPALCACCAERLAEIWRILCGKLMERTGQPRYLLTWGIYEHLLIMRDEERQAIEQVWRATLESNSEEDKDAENLLFPCVLSEKSLDEQLDLIQQRGGHNGHFTEYPPRIGKLKYSDLPAVTRRLEDLVNRDHKYSHNLLWQLAYSLSSLDEALKKTLVRFYREGDTVTRGLCLQIFAKTEDREIHRFLTDEGWRADRAGGDFERHWGSVLLCRQAIEMAFTDLVEHVCPSLLGYAIQHRGKQQEEVLAYAQLMNKIWSGIARRPLERHSEAHRTTITSHNIEQSRDIGSWKISDQDESSVNFVSWDSIWGGRVGEINADTLRQAFDSDGRLRKLNEANQNLQHIVEAERRAGNPWFLRVFEPSALVDVVIACPGYAHSWANAIIDDMPGADALLASCRGFYEALCAVLLDSEPEIGVQLFRRLRVSNAFRVTDSITQIDSLLFSLFSAENSEPVIQLRRRLLANCNTDKCLFEMAFLAQFHSRQEGLHQVVEEWLASKQPFNEARGLTLLGFMDAEIEGIELRKRIAKQRASWIRSRAEIAERVHHRNQWAKHWFRVFLLHGEDLKAWAAFRLFLHCADRRFWLWGPGMVEGENAKIRRKEHYYSNLGNIRKAAKKSEKGVLKLEKRFVGIDIKENQVWPWMSQYTEHDRNP